MIEPDDTQELDLSALDDVVEETDPLPAEQIASSPYADKVEIGAQDEVSA